MILQQTTHFDPHPVRPVAVATQAETCELKPLDTAERRWGFWCDSQVAARSPPPPPMQAPSRSQHPGRCQATRFARRELAARRGQRPRGPLPRRRREDGLEGDGPPRGRPGRGGREAPNSHPGEAASQAFYGVRPHPLVTTPLYCRGLLLAWRRKGMIFSPRPPASKSSATTTSKRSCRVLNVWATLQHWSLWWLVVHAGTLRPAINLGLSQVLLRDRDRANVPTQHADLQMHCPSAAYKGSRGHRTGVCSMWDEAARS